MGLTPRLKTVLGLVPRCRTAADIGTDHGLLLAALLEKGICEKGIGSDLNPGPLEAARRTLEERGLTDRGILILSDGLDELPVNEMDAVVLAGMGGELIAELVLRSDGLRSPDKAVICQPMTRGHVLRRRLCAAGFRLEEEAAAREGQRLYCAMRFRWDGIPRNLTEAETYTGLLTETGTVEARDYLQKELHKLRHISLFAQGTPEAETANTLADEIESIIQKGKTESNETAECL